MKKFIIIKIAAIGDVIMALPMLDEIRYFNKNAHITWVCGKAVYSLLKEFDIDEIIVVDEKKILSGNKFEKIKEVFKLWGRIAFRCYDSIFIAHADKRYRIITIFSFSKCKKSFSREIGNMLPIFGRHHSDEYARLTAGDKNIGENRLVKRNCQFKLPEAISSKVFEVLKQCTGLKKIVLSPGGAKNVMADDACRRWPIKNYVELTDRLLSDGYDVIIVGAASDLWINKYFQNRAVINLIGKTSLVELVELISKADYFVSHDSGPMHLAGLTKTKIIALFGPTMPMEKVPKNGNSVYIWKNEDLPCCPCYDGKYYVACKDNICMSRISVDDVLGVINGDIK